MGERKAVNKYYPPDWDPSKGGLDKYHGVHPLRERASKLHLGIMVIRFEMPFNMWCGGCEKHIGMGVRYNAEKKKIGMYYTTPLWQFRMKCHLCDNYIEMHTDPKNFDYIVASGGRRKEERYDQNDAECAAAHEAEERKKLSTDPMFKLQYQSKDVAVVEEAGPIIDKLQERQDVWKDDYQLNQGLRKRHREDVNSDKAANIILKKKMGLDLKMLPTSKTDKLTSSFVRYSKDKAGLKLKKKCEISSIFCDKKAAILTSLKQAGVKCNVTKEVDILKSSTLVSKVGGKRRRRSATDSSQSSGSQHSSSAASSNSSHNSSENPHYTSLSGPRRTVSEPSNRTECVNDNQIEKFHISSEPSNSTSESALSIVTNRDDDSKVLVVENSTSSLPDSEHCVQNSSLVSGYSSSGSSE